MTGPLETGSPGPRDGCGSAGALEFGALAARSEEARASATRRRTQQLLAKLYGVGGVASCSLVVELLREQVGQPLSLLGRWLAAREVVEFDGAGDTLLPLFQFDWESARTKRGVKEVLAELRPVFDDMEVAEWFAEPNLWLGGRAPAALLDRHPDDVIGAARADRFIARG